MGFVGVDFLLHELVGTLAVQIQGGDLLRELVLLFLDGLCFLEGFGHLLLGFFQLLLCFFQLLLGFFELLLSFFLEFLVFLCDLLFVEYFNVLFVYSVAQSLNSHLQMGLSEF